MSLVDEATIDAFAGGGGASTGIEAAYRDLGLDEVIDVAVNHDDDALAMHAANHPKTLHVREDVFKVNMRRLVGRRLVRLLWLSPDCKHFSKAKGGKPVEKRIRGLAWVAVKWAKQLKPRVIALENVEEFQDWGPLIKTAGGWYPDPARKGQTFDRFINQLRALGYRIEWRELRACDYGAPTIRKRLFVICRRDKAPIVWPKPTHGKGLRPYRTAAECIDFNLGCRSIFDRERPLADATLRRIARGTRRYVVDDADPFIVNMAHGGKVEPIGAPVSTIATEKGGCRAVVVPTLIQTGYGERPGQAPRVPGLRKPLGTLVDGGKHALVTAFLAQHNTMPGGAPHPGHDARKPVSTISGKGAQQQLVTSHLVKLKGTCRDGGRVTEPAPTIQAGGLHHGEVRAFLVKYFSSAVGQRLNDPAATLTALPRLGLLQAEIAPLSAALVERARKVADLLRKYGEWDEREFVTVEVHGAIYVVVDLAMRMLTPRELARAQGFPDSYVIDRGADGRVLTKSAQVRMIGNSVSPPIAKALVYAQFAAEVRQLRRRAA